MNDDIINDDILNMISEFSKNIDLNQLNMYQNNNYLTGLDNINFDSNERQRRLQDATDCIARKRAEEEARSKRMVDIAEESLMLDNLKVFLLQSVNRDQKEILERIESLIDITLVGNKTEEANLAIIQEELNNLKMSTDNLNESFIELIKSKMVEKGVETAISYLLIGLKTLFFS